MTNHSNDFPPEMKEFLDKFKAKDRVSPFVGAEREVLKEQFIREEIGATGRYPEGKLHKRDEGEIAFAVGIEQDKVILNFGTPVTWIGFPAEQAIELGRLLIKRAKRIR